MVPYNNYINILTLCHLGFAFSFMYTLLFILEQKHLQLLQVENCQLTLQTLILLFQLKLHDYDRLHLSSPSSENILCDTEVFFFC